MSRTFTDTHGTAWHVSFSVSAAKRLLASEEPIDILDAKQLAAAFDDPFRRFALLWAGCQTQALEIGVGTPEEFDARLIPPGIDAQEAERVWLESETAMREALVDFFLRIGQKALAAVITKTIAARARLDGVAVGKLEGAAASELIEHAAQRAGDEIDKQLLRGRETLDQLGKTSTN